MDDEKTRNLEGLVELYANLGQSLDGLWFMKVEEKLGFTEALAIDAEVWSIYGKIEARRLKQHFTAAGMLDGMAPVEVLDFLARKSLFNKTLQYASKITSDGSLLFLVEECRTYDAMCKVGRPEDEIETVCTQIGHAFFQSFAGEVDARFKVTCLFTPFKEHAPGCESYKDERVCGWSFSLPA